MVSGLDLRQQLHQLYGHNHLLVRILVGSILILVPQLHVTWQLKYVFSISVAWLIISISDNRCVSAAFSASLTSNISLVSFSCFSSSITLTSLSLSCVDRDKNSSAERFIFTSLLLQYEKTAKLQKIIDSSKDNFQKNRNFY